MLKVSEIKRSKDRIGVPGRSLEHTGNLPIHVKGRRGRDAPDIIGSHRNYLRPCSTSPRIPPIGIKKWQSSTKPEKGIQGTEKDDEEGEKEVEVLFRRNTEGTDRVQQQFIIQPSRKIRQGSHQERARKGIGNGPSLGNKLRHIRQTCVGTNKRQPATHQLVCQWPRTLKQNLLRQVTKRNTVEWFKDGRGKKLEYRREIPCRST